MPMLDDVSGDFVVQQRQQESTSTCQLYRQRKAFALKRQYAAHIF